MQNLILASHGSLAEGLSLIHILQAIEDVNQPYVILAPAHMIYRQDFSNLLDAHIESGADITMLYQNVDNAKEAFINCDVLNLNKQKGVLSIEKNRGNSKSKTISLETYVMSKDLFISLVKKAANISSLYWFRDIVNEECSELDIRGVAHRGFVACVNDFKSYFNANIDLLDYDKAMDLFNSDWPIYTRTNAVSYTHLQQKAINILWHLQVEKRCKNIQTKIGCMP